MYSPPGTSDVWDVRTVNLDIPESRGVTIKVYDDKALTDRVGTFAATA